MQAKQVVCKPHNTTGATANRFENDLVRQPQADCFSVLISLIIPHKGTGSLLVSLTQNEPADHRYESDMFLLDGSRRYCCRAVPDGKKKKKNLWPATAVWASLSSAPVSLPVTWLILPNPIEPPRDSRWEHGRERWQDRVTERDTYLIYCMWSDCTGGLGLAGNSHLLLLFFIIFHEGPLQLTHLRHCKHILMWIIHL